MKMLKIVTKDCCKNETIYSYLKKNGHSENFLKHLRKQFGFIKLNNKNVFISEKVYNNNTLEIAINPFGCSKIAPCDFPINIIYEDEHILAVNKPSGIATMPTQTHYAKNLGGMIVNYMQKKDCSFVLRIINRLDKDTAGIILVAKNSIISNLLNTIHIDKTYHFVCLGKIDNFIAIKKPIETKKDENGFNIQKRVVSTNGKMAETFVTPLKTFMIDKKCYTFAKATLNNGRTHQIRVHLSSINHPLLSDELYGEKSNLIDHTCLCCDEITFFHPLLKKEIHLKVPISNNILAIINKN